VSREYTVEVQKDFLERLTKAQPATAVAELIWNGLDADAAQIDVELSVGPLGQIDKIVVSDNGHGIPYSEAPTLFKKLGDSWKKYGARHTKTKRRMLHGQEGRGRFRAFALGGVVDWQVVYPTADGFSSYTISILESDIDHVRISDEVSVSGENSGVTVVVSELKRNFTSLKPENSLQEFSGEPNKGVKSFIGSHKHNKINGSAICQPPIFSRICRNDLIHNLLISKALE
jgi:hypothetical protein